MGACKGSADWGFNCFIEKPIIYVVEKIIHVQDTGMGVTCQSSVMIRSISGKCTSTSQSSDNLLNFCNYPIIIETCTT